MAVLLGIDQTLQKQAERLNGVSSRYESNKKFWVAAISDLDKKVQVDKATFF